MSMLNEPAVLEPRPHAPRARLLLAEDDVELRRVLAHALRMHGYEVLAASNGHEVLTVLSAVSRGELPVPDALVMDVRMPEHSGMAVLLALRLAEWRTPVVLMTAFGDEALHARAAELGAVAVLDKPFDLDVLVRTLAEAVPQGKA